MVERVQIETPAKYVSATALGFAANDGTLTLVGPDTPLPITNRVGGAVAPLVGSASQSGMAGPFAAAANATLVLTLSGTWQGSVSLLRSTDAGVTKSPLQVAGMAWGSVTTSGCEQMWTETEESVTFFLDIQLISGAVAYRLAQ